MSLLKWLDRNNYNVPEVKEPVKEFSIQHHSAEFWLNWLAKFGCVQLSCEVSKEKVSWRCTVEIRFDSLFADISADAEKPFDAILDCVTKVMERVDVLQKFLDEVKRLKE